MRETMKVGKIAVLPPTGLLNELCQLETYFFLIDFLVSIQSIHVFVYRCTHAFFQGFFFF